jgi:hypothetical protein
VESPRRVSDDDNDDAAPGSVPSSDVASGAVAAPLRSLRCLENFGAASDPPPLRIGSVADATGSGLVCAKAKRPAISEDASDAAAAAATAEEGAAASEEAALEARLLARQQEAAVLQYLSVFLRRVATAATASRGGMPPFR